MHHLGCSLRRGGRQAGSQAGPAGARQEVTAARDPAAGAEPVGPAWWAPTKRRGSRAAPTSELSEGFLQTQIAFLAVEKCVTVPGPHPSQGNQASFQPPPTAPPVSMKASVSQLVGCLPLAHTLARAHRVSSVLIREVHSVPVQCIMGFRRPLPISGR